MIYKVTALPISYYKVNIVKVGTSITADSTIITVDDTTIII
jgi:hypothetical protein